MTIFNEKSKDSFARTRLDELDVLINAAYVSGNKELSQQMQELRPDIEEFLQNLQSLVDPEDEKKYQDWISELVKNSDKNI